MFSFILLCISGGLKFLVWCCVFLIPTDDWLNNINIMAVTMEFNLTATFPLVAWKHIWSYELKLKKNKLGLTVGGLILRVICCLHCMISTLFLLQHFELQFHCSAASSQRVSSHFFKYLRCFFVFSLHAFLSHLQVVNDEELADQEYEDDFEVIMQPISEIGHMLKNQIQLNFCFFKHLFTYFCVTFACCDRFLF